MGDRRLTIGVTVNLGHYENLRVEVEGEPGESARELAGFLDGVLATFGRADPPTAGLIDRYRERVLANGTGPAVEHGDVPSPDTEVPPLPEGPGPDGPVEEVPGVEALMYAFPSDPGSPGEVEHGDETGVFEAFGHGEGEESWLPAAGQEAPGVPAATGETDPAGPFALFPGTPVCQECHIPVSPAEEKLSRLFASRVLCRSCLKKMQ